MSADVVATRDVAELSVGRVHYTDIGVGKPVIFLHGGLANGNLWRGVTPYIADGYRCLIPDLPKGSHPEPMYRGTELPPPDMARLVISFMDSLGIEDAHLVTNDSGGAVGQILTATYPDRVRSLVLTSCDTYRQFPPRYLKPVHVVAQIPGAAIAIARLWTWRWVQRVFYASLVWRPVPSDVLAGYVDPMNDPRIRRDIAIFFRGIRLRHTVDAAAALSQIDLPVLIVWGANDLWFSKKNAAKLAAALPDARLTILTECRTFVPEDQPDRLGELVRDFLAEVEPSA